MSIVCLALRPATARRPEKLVTVQTSIDAVQEALVRTAYIATARYAPNEKRHKAAIRRWLRNIDIEIYSAIPATPRACA